MSKRKKGFDGAGILTGQTSRTTTLQTLTDVGYGDLERLQQQFSGQLNFASDGSMWVGRVQLTRIGLPPETIMNEGEYRTIAEIMKTMTSSINWLLGDLLAYGERVWGQTALQIADEVGLDVKTIHNFTSVCRKVDFSRRRENLTYSHHVEVAALSPEAQSFWLNEAEDNSWSIRQLRTEINEALGVVITKSLVDQAPKVDHRFRKLFDQAKQGDDEAADKVRDFLEKMQQWIQSVAEQLD